MKRYFITFRSVTFAQRGERLFQERGITCALQRTPRWMEEQGCGYALGVRTEDVAPAVRLLREQNIPLRRVYERRNDGNLEAMAL